MKFGILLQYLVPQRALSKFAGIVSDCRWGWWKNWVIHSFIKRYNVDLKSAEFENVADYPNFNLFFTRKLKPNLRPIVQGVNDIASPVDGSIQQYGTIQQGELLQAKGFYFNLKNLLGDKASNMASFENGNFITFYLAPKDYHRVHMPISGELRETVYIPGKLFSVNQATSHHVPQLFTINERLVCMFDTVIGPLAIILVGAMIVSGIEVMWPLQKSTTNIVKKVYNSNSIRLERGKEIGYFKVGSTVIILFPKNTMSWSNNILQYREIKMGELIGNVTL